MENSNNIIEGHSKEDYNAIPVVYCKNCLSLKIITLNNNIDYCDNCGCTDTDSTNIESWLEMYKNKYGKPF